MAATQPFGPAGDDPAAAAAWAEVDRQDAHAVLAARQELGPSYDDALADAFAERVERTIDARVRARLAEERDRRAHEGRRDGQQLALGITSLCLGIPISGVAAGISHLPGLAVAWAGIAVVNGAYAWQARRRDR